MSPFFENFYYHQNKVGDLLKQFGLLRISELYRPSYTSDFLSIWRARLRWALLSLAVSSEYPFHSLISTTASSRGVDNFLNLGVASSSVRGIICPLIWIGLGAIHKLCRLKGGGGHKLPILLSKKTTKRGRGSKIAGFETTYFVDGPLTDLPNSVGMGALVPPAPLLPTPLSIIDYLRTSRIQFTPGCIIMAQ